jgi:gamma-glutamylcyclotransferase
MRRVWTFFYGSFMNSEVLAKADVKATETQMARLDGWDIKIAPRATLVPSAGRSVFGVLAQLAHSDLDKLYTKDWFGFGTYLPEAVLVADSAGRFVPALSYIAWEMEGGMPSAEYIEKVVTVARQFNFPEWYVTHIKSFASGSS